MENEKIGKMYISLIAKREKDSDTKYLPLWMHLKDTAEIMRRLVNAWVPKSVIKSTGLGDEVFNKTAVFLAATHDIGKATASFQNIICDGLEDWIYDMSISGLNIKCSNLNRGKTPHAYSGEWILRSQEIGFCIDKSVSTVIGAHHGKPNCGSGLNGEDDLIQVYPQNFYGECADNNTKEAWKGIWKEILNNALKLSGMVSVNEIPVLSVEAQIVISGLLIVADWLSSNTEFFPLIDRGMITSDDIYPKRIEQGWSRCHFPDGWIPEADFMNEDLFRERFNFYPNAVQKEMLNVVNNAENLGIVILEAQMGCGKTESALSISEVVAKKNGSNGIFFGLPTQATSNGIYGRLLEWAGRVSEDTENSIRLAHGGATFNEEYQHQIASGKLLVYNGDSFDNPIVAHPWFQGNKRALLSDFVIGTVDQFLMAALKRKHFMLRHFGLAGKVVIIDECHAYDSYMNQYLEETIKWMARYGVTVILLSATLPTKRRSEIVKAYVGSYKAKKRGKTKREKKAVLFEQWETNIEYPLITWSDGEEVRQKVVKQEVVDKEIKVELIDKYRITKSIDEKLCDGGCACIIANTVKSAQEYYDIIKESLESVDVLLYHAQYMMTDRAEKEKIILEKMGKASDNSERNRFVLVGTQVLEQSLDYDADIMFTEFCPMDLLMQRLGRLHRHDRNKDEEEYSRPKKLEKPELYILIDSDDGGDLCYDKGSAMIYGEYLLMRTKKILPLSINIPKDIPYLVNAVYDFEDDLGLEESFIYQEAKKEYEGMIGGKKARANTFLLKFPKLQGTIDNILVNCSDKNEMNAEASVRDTDSTITVLLAQRNGEGEIHLINDSGRKLQAEDTLSNEDAYELAKQRLNLPGIFSSQWMIKKVINELEVRQEKDKLMKWQESSWIQGELILLLDENYETELSGYKLKYDKNRGLSYTKGGGVLIGE